MTRPTLEALVAGLGISLPQALRDFVPAGLALDSRRVAPGEVFLALAGSREHGIAHVAEASRRGAALVLAEAPAPAAPPATELPVLWVAGLHAMVSELAARWYGRPSEALHVIGVTGTNGKTSTVQLVAQLLSALGHKTATLGTLGAGLHGALKAGERTTPDAIAVQAALAEFRAAGATHVAMEVSSHALVQGRVEAVRFEVAAFTNLTRDHLDYHGTMQAYGAAKARLFALPGLATAVLNLDDGFGRELAGRMAPGLHVLGTSAAGATTDIVAREVATGGEGLAFQLVTPWGEAVVRSRLVGRFNVANLLAVVGCVGALGEPFARIAAALSTLAPVAGRMNALGGRHGQPLVVIDYAHTPDALEQALAAVREHCAQRLVCVFGCGGERDRGKRPQMGALAARLADVAIVTDDNPRGEDGEAIVREILVGMRGAAPLVERDRARAIHQAIAMARAGDAVLIAGKGHETYQEDALGRHPFDDHAVAAAELARYHGGVQA